MRNIQWGGNPTRQLACANFHFVHPLIENPFWCGIFFSMTYGLLVAHLSPISPLA